MGSEECRHNSGITKNGLMKRNRSFYFASNNIESKITSNGEEGIYMQKVGLFLVVLWFLGSAILFITAKEMEILLAINYFIFGGLTVICFYVIVIILGVFRKYVKKSNHVK